VIHNSSIDLFIFSSIFNKNWAVSISRLTLFYIRKQVFFCVGKPNYWYNTCHALIMRFSFPFSPQRTRLRALRLRGGTADSSPTVDSHSPWSGHWGYRTAGTSASGTAREEIILKDLWIMFASSLTKKQRIPFQVPQDHRKYSLIRGSIIWMNAGEFGHTYYAVWILIYKNMVLFIQSLKIGQRKIRELN